MFRHVLSLTKKYIIFIFLRKRLMQRATRSFFSSSLFLFAVLKLVAFLGHSYVLPYIPLKLVAFFMIETQRCYGAESFSFVFNSFFWTGFTGLTGLIY